MAARHDSQDDPSEAGSAGLPDFGDHIDLMTFEQILEMDDDEEERDFSKSIVFGFFEQAENTFKNMDASLDNKDLAQLSSLGHFLKGSSATLGLTKVKDSCEKIQHFGASKDETGTTDVADKELCLERIKKTMGPLKRDYNEAEIILKRFYHDS
ncbi:MAG: hypothetical protein LQ350_000632 [Teloschistes chrysophthalmus]|nr:MAG: hypothetical protein LQ350_000632 [Niorma chrysophthalma]